MFDAQSISFLLQTIQIFVMIMIIDQPAGVVALVFLHHLTRDKENFVKTNSRQSDHVLKRVQTNLQSDSKKPKGHLDARCS